MPLTGESGPTSATFLTTVTDAFILSNGTTGSIKEDVFRLSDETLSFVFQVNVTSGPTNPLLTSTGLTRISFTGFSRDTPTSVNFITRGALNAYGGSSPLFSDTGTGDVSSASRSEDGTRIVFFFPTALEANTSSDLFFIHVPSAGYTYRQGGSTSVTGLSSPSRDFALPTPAPEPTTLATAVSGLTMLGLFRLSKWRKQRRVGDVV